MANDLSRQLQALTEAFVHGVITAMRSGSLADILGEEGAGPAAKRGRGRPRKDTVTGAGTSGPSVANGTRPPARSGAAAARMEALIDYVQANPGTNGESTRKALGVERSRWSPMVRQAVDAGRLRTEGEKRGRRYWVA